MWAHKTAQVDSAPQDEPSDSTELAEVLPDVASRSLKDAAK